MCSVSVSTSKRNGSSAGVPVPLWFCSGCGLATRFWGVALRGRRRWAPRTWTLARRGLRSTTTRWATGSRTRHQLPRCLGGQSLVGKGIYNGAHGNRAACAAASRSTSWVSCLGEGSLCLARTSCGSLEVRCDERGLLSALRRDAHLSHGGGPAEIHCPLLLEASNKTVCKGHSGSVGVSPRPRCGREASTPCCSTRAVRWHGTTGPREDGRGLGGAPSYTPAS